MKPPGGTRIISPVLFGFLLFPLAWFWSEVTPTPEPDPIQPTSDFHRVRAVMFWMDGCPHCHYVLDNVLPPLQEQYGNQLEILLIELETREDVDLLLRTAGLFGIPKEETFVPFLVIGDRVLVGSEQIPSELPGLIEVYLAEGGVDVPDIPGLSVTRAIIDNIEITSTPFLSSTSGAQLSPSKTPELSLTEVTATIPPEVLDPVGEVNSPNNGSHQVSVSNGFALAIVIMVAMVAALGFSLAVFTKGAQIFPRMSSSWTDFFILALALAGLVIASYLTYVETQLVSAVCGPIGDCNAVQSSPYARLFGVLPLGVLGMGAYVFILATRFSTEIKSGLSRSFAAYAIFATSLSGTLFSLYLTILELFVIHAVCIWCLASAIIMTLLLLLSIRPVLQIRSLKGNLG